MVTAIAAICLYLDLCTHTFDLLEQKTYGERLEVSAAINQPLAQRARDRIVLVTLTDQSYQWAEKGHLESPVFPRFYQTQMIRDLTRYGAKVIAFDMVFDTPQPGDAELAKAIKQSGRVLLACADQGEDSPEVMEPEAPFLHASVRRGHTRVTVSTEQPAIDRIQSVILSQGHPLTALSVQAARMGLGLNDLPPVITARGWQFADLPLPLDRSGALKIRYLSPPGQTFSTYPYEELLNCSAAQKKFYLDSGAFRDKIVLIGDITRIHKDNAHLTPVGEMPGVEIQAFAAATVLEGRFLRDAVPFVNVGQIIALAILVALLANSGSLRRAALFLGLLLPAYFLLNIILFVERDLVLPLAAPSFTIVVTALAVLLERGMVEEQEKTRMRLLLQHYVSPQIANHILKHPELLGQGGMRVTGTVLFADIRGFTALSEKMPPEELVRRMNEYFERMTEIIFRHDGTAASIVGDAIMALFGVPVPHPDHAHRAVAAAIEMQEALVELQRQWQVEERKAFDIGIGINTGEMVVGEVGGKHLTTFTVYGLQVNIASRVENLTRSLHCRILITRSTYEAIDTAIEVRGPIQASVKGMELPLEVFEVLGIREEVDDDHTLRLGGGRPADAGLP